MKRLISAVAVAAVAIMAVASVASAEVARYQTTNSLTATATYNGVDFVHNYTLTMNPCQNNTFTGSASGGIVPGETVSGTLDGSTIHIRGSYPISAAYPNGYTWHYDGPLSGGTGHDSTGLSWHIAFTTDTSHFKNHGDYVSSHGGGSDAAHSCIGMPIQ